VHLGMPQHNFIMLEMDDRMDEDRGSKGTMRVRHYPRKATGTPFRRNADNTAWESVPESVRYSATLGTIKFKNENRVREVSGFLEFTGNDVVKVPYPVDSSAAVAPVIQKIGKFVDLSGEEFKPRGQGWLIEERDPPKLILDNATGEIRADRQCYGLVKYTYTTCYSICQYTPTVFTDMYGQYIPNKHRYGKIIVIEEPPKDSVGREKYVLTFQVTPPNVPDQSIEMYRIEYSVIVNSEGTWEKPTSWPTNGIYEGTPPPPSLDESLPYMEVPRLLEVAYFSLTDPQIANASVGATDTVLPVPLFFDKLEKYKGMSEVVSKIKDQVIDVTKLANRSPQYWSDIRNFPPPQMRIVTYDYRASKPYDLTGLSMNEWKYRVWREEDAKKLKVESTGVFKIRLKITVGKMPLAQTPPPVPEEDANAKSWEDYYIMSANDTAYRAWAVIDWKALYESIKKRYPTQVFNYEGGATEMLAMIAKLQPTP